MSITQIKLQKPTVELSKMNMFMSLDLGKLTAAEYIEIATDVHEEFRPFHNDALRNHNDIFQIYRALKGQIGAVNEFLLSGLPADTPMRIIRIINDANISKWIGNGFY